MTICYSSDKRLVHPWPAVLCHCGYGVFFLVIFVATFALLQTVLLGGNHTLHRGDRDSERRKGGWPMPGLYVSLSRNVILEKTRESVQMQTLYICRFGKVFSEVSAVILSFSTIDLL